MNRSDRLKVIIAAEPMFKIVGESGNGTEALELIKRLSPDLAVLDISMPGMSGLDVALQFALENKGAL